MNLYLWVISSFVITASYWLEEHTKWIAHISGVVLIIIISSILGTMGVIPSVTEVYNLQFKWMVPLGIILMLLTFNPKSLLRINKDYLRCFIIGTTATAIGGIIAGLVLKNYLPQDYWRISGQFTASFIGGYENAVSVGTGLNTPNNVFLQAFTGDSILTTLWIMINIFQGRKIIVKANKVDEKNDVRHVISNSIDITSMCVTITVAFIILAFSDYIYRLLPIFPQILWASIISTAITFTPLRERFSGSYIFGSVLLSYFIFGCGAISNIPYLFGNATVLLLFPALIVLIHALILFPAARFLKINKEIVIVTSQCLIGGPATALSVVFARKWDCQFEAITLGLLGYAIGNYIGFAVAWILM